MGPKGPLGPAGAVLKVLGVLRVLRVRALLVLALIVIMALTAFWHAGRYLSAPAGVAQPADCIVALGGDTGDRIVTALDLYRRGAIDLVQDQLFADIVITRREPTSAQI